MRDQDLSPAPDPVIELYKRDVDRTLLRQNLRRSVEERILNLMELQRVAEELRRAGQRGRERDLEALAELEALLEERRRLDPADP